MARGKHGSAWSLPSSSLPLNDVTRFGNMLLRDILRIGIYSNEGAVVGQAQRWCGRSMTVGEFISTLVDGRLPMDWSHAARASPSSSAFLFGNSLDASLGLTVVEMRAAVRWYM